MCRLALAARRRVAFDVLEKYGLASAAIERGAPLRSITYIYHFDRPTYHPAYRIQFDGRTADDIIYDDRFEVIAPLDLACA